MERAGETVCRMTPAVPAKTLSFRDLATLLQEIPEPDAAYASDVRRAVRAKGRPPRTPWGR